MTGALILMSVPVFATERSYEMTIPYPYVGSLQSTPVYVKDTSGAAYFKPSINTIATKYFVSPWGDSQTLATDIITKSNTTKSTFTWYEGYGGVGNHYCLSAYPAVNGEYDAYVVKGVWSN